MNSLSANLKEEDVLGMLLILASENEKQSEMIIKTSKNYCFKSKINNIIFNAIFQLHNNKEKIDEVSLYGELQRQKNIEEVGGAIKLASLTAKIMSVEPLEKLFGTV